MRSKVSRTTRNADSDQMEKKIIGGRTKKPTVAEQRLALFTREALLMAGFKPAYAKKAMQCTVEAMDAETMVQTGKFDFEAKPDHRNRLSAADKVFKMIDVYPTQRGETGNGKATIVEVQLCTPDGGRTVVRVEIGRAHV